MPPPPLRQRDHWCVLFMLHQHLLAGLYPLAHRPKVHLLPYSVVAIAFSLVLFALCGGTWLYANSIFFTGHGPSMGVKGGGGDAYARNVLSLEGLCGWFS